VQPPNINLPELEKVGEFNLKELAVLLVKHFNLHEGLYEVSVGFQIGVGAIGPTPELSVPGAMFGVANIGLVKAKEVNPHAVDAKEVNPIRKSKK
jgi:hypothetical protein